MVTSANFSKRSSSVQSLLVIGVLILINLIASSVYLRLDFTEDKRYTLSSSTKNILKNLPEVVTLTAYFSKELPPELLPVRREFQELLVEYESRSGGNLVYALENPNANPEDEKRAQQAGISPLMLNVRRRDEVKQMRVYMGVTLHAGNKKEIIPYLKQDRSAEHALTTALKKLIVAKKPSLAVIQSGSSATLEQLKSFQNQLVDLYAMTPFSLSDSLSIPTTYQALLWVGPKESILPEDLEKLSQYLRQGGSLFLSYSAVEADLQGARPTLKPANDIGIVDWLQAFGVYLQTGTVLIDGQSSAITVAQQTGGFVFNTQIQFPYFPIVQPEKGHPISNDLEATYLQFVSPLSYTSKDSTQPRAVVPLLRSSELTGLRSLPEYIDVQKQWGRADFRDSPKDLALALKGGDLLHAQAKMVVVGASDFLVPQKEGQRIPEPNALLAANAIDWLADDTGLIELRSKGINSRPLKNIEDSTKMLLKWGNALVPILFILIYAFIRNQYRLRKRRHWMEQR